MMLLYITASGAKEAEKISRALLDEKLIACADFFESNSIYNWKGKRVKGKEFVIFAKTTEAKAAQAEKKVKEIHSYEIPCIIKIPVKANKEYEEWVEKEVGK